MGFLKDLGTSRVDSIDQKTGYPKDRFGHLLNPRSPDTCELVKSWHKPGTLLFNLTSPYGHLEYAVGTGDDFYCFDYAIVKSMHQAPATFLILHSVINSETGSFIQDSEYRLIHEIDYDYQAIPMIDQALNWLTDDPDTPLRHSKKGWNQDPWYFARCVHLTWQDYHQERIRKFSEREKRFGGKNINKFCKIPI